MNKIRVPSDTHVDLFRSVFKGREDVFAIHWEKGNKSGYMPAYQYDPHMYRLHKMKGDTLRIYKYKTYLPLTNVQIIKHLNGEQLIGIYPLLKDNTSWFIAADFDEEKSKSAKATQERSWSEERLALIEACKEKGIPA